MLAAVCSAGCPRDGGTQDAATGPVDVYVPPPRAVVIGPLRPLGPAGTATVNTPRPTLRWAQPDGVSLAHVDVCADRACARIEQSFEAAGAGAPASALAAGVHYWRVALAGQTTPVWEFFVRAHRAADVDTAWGTTADVNGDGRPEVFVASNHGGAMQEGRVGMYLGASGGIGQSPDGVITGPEANGHFGWSVVAAGDVNGDGYGDLAVGAPHVNGNDGRVYVFFGGAAGLGAQPSQALAPQEPLGNFGYVMAAAGDVDGDGYGDLLVGQAAAAGTSGRAYIFHGGAAGLDGAHPVVLAPPADDGSAFGIAVGGAGDANGDGYSDVVVGASSANSGVGAAYLYLGRADATAPAALTLTAPMLASGAEFGWYVGLAGDLNGDGLCDLVVGAPATAMGNVFVYHGGPTVALAPAITLQGESRMSSYGWPAMGAGDLNGDGFDDLAIAATCEHFGIDPDGGVYPHCGTGMVYIHNGSRASVAPAPSLALASPNEAEAAFGWALAAADVDGDGYGDLVASAYAAHAYDGAAYVFRGGAAGLASAPFRTFLGGDSTSENLGWSLALRTATHRGRRAL